MKGIMTETRFQQNDYMHSCLMINIWFFYFYQFTNDHFLVCVNMRVCMCKRARESGKER